MAGSLNKVTLIGNLGRDPEIRNTNDGREIANFTLATSETWKDKASGERREKTEWHRVVIFNEGLVRVIKDFVRKGSKVYVEGALQTRKWVDANGAEKYTTEVVVQNFNGSIILLDNKGESAHNGTEGLGNSSLKEGGSAGTFDYSELDDEIPF